MEAISAILVLWNICLTIVLVLLHKCQKNQETLLYRLRDEINAFKSKRGHIFVTNIDDDFTCPKVNKK